jgi:hypothetical protein
VSSENSTLHNCKGKLRAATKKEPRDGDASGDGGAEASLNVKHDSPRLSIEIVEKGAFSLRKTVVETLNRTFISPKTKMRLTCTS